MDTKATLVPRPMTPAQQYLSSEIREQSILSSLSSKQQLVDIDSAEEYDTDIESEVRSRWDNFDKSGVDTYRKTCRKLKQIPIRQVCHGLSKSHSIHVKNRGLTPYAALGIANALLVNVTVTELNLDGNRIHAKGVQYLSWMLTENLSITTLSLKDNDIGSAGLVELCDTLRQNNILTSVNLSGNNFQDTDGAHIKNVLVHNTTLLELDLSYNNFGDEGASVIAEGLAANDYLRVLDLSWNKIRPLGAVNLSKAIRENVMLKRLNLSMNGLAYHGCASISSALQHNDSLTELDVSRTRLTDSEAAHLIPVLAHNETLRVLNVSHNTLSSTTACAFLETIRNNENSSLIKLDMSGVPMIRPVHFYILQVKKQQPDFKFIPSDLVTYLGPLDAEEFEVLTTADPFRVIQWLIDIRMLKISDILSPEGAVEVVKPQLSTSLKKFGLRLTDKQLDQLYRSPDGVAIPTVNVKVFAPDQG